MLGAQGRTAHWTAMKTVLAATLLATIVAVPACTSPHGGNKDCGYDYTSPNARGTLIPIKDRKPCTFKADLNGGGHYDLSTERGKVAVVSFWASWCNPCQVETPQYDLMYRGDKAHGVTFVGVDTKDDKSSAKSFIKDNTISFPIVYDEPGAVALGMGNLPVDSLPFTALVDKHGRIAAVYKGRQSPKDLQPALDTLAVEH